MSVCLSVPLGSGGNAMFSTYNYDRGLISFKQIHFVYEHPFDICLERRSISQLHMVEM